VKEMKQITMCPTKAGRGYKVAVNNEWFYTSTGELIAMLGGKTAACKFRGIPQKTGGDSA